MKAPKLVFGILVAAYIGFGLASTSHGTAPISDRDGNGPHKGDIGPHISNNMEPDGHGSKLDPDGHGSHLSKRPIILRSVSINGVPSYLQINARKTQAYAQTYSLDENSVYLIGQDGQPVLLGTKAAFLQENAPLQQDASLLDDIGFSPQGENNGG